MSTSCRVIFKLINYKKIVLLKNNAFHLIFHTSLNSWNLPVHIVQHSRWQ